MAYVHRPRIAYPGAAGSYTQEASAVLYPDADLYSAGTFDDVFEHVRSGEAAAGVLPIENSLAGLVVETWDLLSEGELPIGGEAVCTSRTASRSCPARRSRASRRSTRTPSRCSSAGKFLNGRYDRIATSTTSDAVMAVAEAGDPRHAAIASPGAAERYGLEILLEEISDHPENFTRFVAVSRGPMRPFVPGLPWRTALRVVTNHRPGALHEAIEPLRYHGVNMVSLHSRPIPGEPWRYQFSLDIDGHRDEETVQRALADVERRSARVVVMGVYPTTARPGS